MYVSRGPAFLPEVNRRAPIRGPTRCGTKTAIRVNQGDGTMKLSRLFMIALLVGTMGVIGCGDDSSSSGNGNGGDVDPNAECNVGVCIENATFKQICIDEITDCIATGRGTTEQCIAFGTETCTA